MPLSDYEKSFIVRRAAGEYGIDATLRVICRNHKTPQSHKDYEAPPISVFAQKLRTYLVTDGNTI